MHWCYSSSIFVGKTLCYPHKRGSKVMDAHKETPSELQGRQNYAELLSRTAGAHRPHQPFSVDVKNRHGISCMSKQCKQ